MKTVSYPLATFFTEHSSDIVFMEFPQNLKVDLASAKKLVASRLEFTKNQKHFLVIDISNVRHVSADAKEFMQRPDAGLKNILAAAFIASNPVSALIASIFIKTPKNFEARFFSGKEAAFEWIHAQRTKLLNIV